MTALNTPPSGVGEFGHDFNYAVWTPGTNIQLCNVAWANDYRDIRPRRRVKDIIVHVLITPERHNITVIIRPRDITQLNVSARRPHGVVKIVPGEVSLVL